MRRVTYANVVSSLALFIALGGVSWAAVTLPKNSVGSKQLRKGAVASSDLKKRAVTSSKVKDGSLLAQDFKAGQLPAGAAGPAGAPGAPGAPGAQGPAGPTEGVVATGGLELLGPKDSTLWTSSLTTSKPGRLYLSVTVRRDITCGGPYRAALTVDGQFVAGSVTYVPSDDRDVVRLDGITSAALAAGNHALEVQGNCELGDTGLATLQAANVKAIVLGG